MRRNGIQELIKGIEDYTDEELAPEVREAIEFVLPDYMDRELEKSVGDSPRSEVRVSDLVTEIGNEFAEAQSPVLERIKKSSDRLESLEKAVFSLTDAVEDLAALHERMQRALGGFPEQTSIVKSLVEHRESSPARYSEYGYDARSTPSGRGGLSQNQAADFTRALDRAETLRAEHYIEIPGCSRAVAAYGSGRVTKDIAETLIKSIGDIESGVGVGGANRGPDRHNSLGDPLL